LGDRDLRDHLHGGPQSLRGGRNPALFPGGSLIAAIGTFALLTMLAHWLSWR
jgi:hypothetical protein